MNILLKTTGVIVLAAIVGGVVGYMLGNNDPTARLQGELDKITNKIAIINALGLEADWDDLRRRHPLLNDLLVDDLDEELAGLEGLLQERENRRPR